MALPALPRYIGAMSPRGHIVLVSLALTPSLMLACASKPHTNAAQSKGPQSTAGPDWYTPEEPPPKPPPPPSPPKPVCPAQYDDARRLPIDCNQPGSLECRYPLGRCMCHAPRQCGGMYRKPVYHWTCINNPPAIRPDGCPGTSPRAGGTCTPEGKLCSYGPCAARAKCIGSKWQLLPNRPKP